MPELPDIELYLHALRPRLLGQTVAGIRIAAPFLVRTTEPPVDAVIGRRITGLRRVGKRIAIDADGVVMVVHLMIAGRFRWLPPGSPIPRRVGLAALDVATGTLVLTEAGTTRRASLHMARGADGVAALDPGGLEPLDADLASFTRQLTAERHTLKRALTDPSLFSGIGNAYSDEILHRARLSPLRLSDALSATDLERLFDATRATLTEWRDALIAETGDGISGAGHGVPSRDARPRTIRPAVPGVRHAGAADSLRRQRSQLLPDVPDRGSPARRPRAVTPAQGRLAAHPRGARAAQARSALTGAPPLVRVVRHAHQPFDVEAGAPRQGQRLGERRLVEGDRPRQHRQPLVVAPADDDPRQQLVVSQDPEVAPDRRQAS